MRVPINILFILIILIYINIWGFKACLFLGSKEADKGQHWRERGEKVWVEPNSSHHVKFYSIRVLLGYMSALPVNFC